MSRYGRHRFGGKDFRMDAQRTWALLPGSGSGTTDNYAQVTHAYNVTTSASLPLSGSAFTLSNFALMSATEEILAYGTFVTSPSYTGTITIKPVFRAIATSGSVVMDAGIDADTFSPSALTGSSTGSQAIELFIGGGVAAGAFKPSSLQMTINASAQMALRFYARRYGTHSSDNFPEPLAFCGWEIVYG